MRCPGPFRIYRAPGSVAFLSCGTALQPILRKSQVWCVDEESSKFILQIRRPQFWRIEVPVENPEDQQRAEQLREIFDKILQFEKTECPFKRSFTVELPEAQTPVTKRPWAPVLGSGGLLPMSPGTLGDLPRDLWRAKERNGSVGGSECSSVLPGRTSRLAERSESPALEETSPIDGPSRENVPRLSNYYDSRGIHDPEHIDRTGRAWVRGENDAPMEEGDMVDRTGRVWTRGENESVAEEPHMVDRTGRVWARGEDDVPEEESDMVNRTGRVWARGTAGTPEPVEGQNRTVPESPADSQDDSFHSPQSYHEPPPVFNTSSPFHQSSSFQDSSPFHKSSPLPPSPPISHPASPRASPADPHSRPGSQHGTSDVTVLSFRPPTHSKPTDDATVLSVFDEDPTLDSAPAPDAPAPVLERKAATAPATPIDTTPFPPLPSSTALVSTSTAKRPKIRHRATTSSSISPDRRPLSPLPPAAKLLTPRPKVTGNTTTNANANKSTLAAVRRLPMTVITKTFEILMSPPSHLIHLMLKVAARILAGEWRGLVFGIDDYGEQIPVQWDWSDDDEVVASRCFIDDDWAPRTGYKMAGTFPESDDEEGGSPGGGGAKLGEASKSAGAGTPTPLGRGEAAVESEWSRRLGVD